jgi:broad specificity phosphatase PhoE
MTQVCKIILVRHGESVNNKQNIVAGDSPLTDKGREQARQAKETLARFHFDEAYSSDMVRAVETAEIISGKKLPPENKLSGLRERNFGSLAGESGVHHDKEHEQRLGMNHEENWAYKYVPDMESDDELSSRFVEHLERLAQQHPGETILVAAHGAAIRTLLMRLNNLTYHDLPNNSFKNAGYVEIDYDGKNLKVVHTEGVRK